MRSQGWCYPLIACQTATASFIPFLLLSLSLFHSLSLLSRSSILLHLWQQYFASHPPPRPRHASPETWHKKRYCATPQFPLPVILRRRDCPSSFSSPPPVFISAASPLDRRRAFGRGASDRVYYTPSLLGTYIYPCPFK